MNSLSLFSGIGGFDIAFERAGIEVDSVCEIDKAAQGILTRHFPNAKLFDDVRKVGLQTHEKGSIDIICGGFPCQDVSVAGKRAGLAGERSGLWFEFARIIDELEPRWVVAENVPGLLSSNKGQDFAVIIQWLAERGYGVSWRILDAQHFGVPQRRRRVFIVGSLGNGNSAKVLFESEGMSGNTPPRREAGKEVAFTIGTNTGSSSKKGDGGINKTMVMTLGHSQSHGLGIGEQNTANTLEGVSSSNQTVLVGALQARDYKGVGNQYVNEGKLVFDAAQITSKQHGSLPSEISQPLNTLGQMSVFDRQRSDEYGEAATASTVAARDYKSASDLVTTRWDSQRARIHDPNGVAPTLQSGAKTSGNIIPATWTIRGGKEGGGKESLASADKAMTLGGQQQYLFLETLKQIRYNTGEGDKNASTQKNDTGKILRDLREKIGEEAFAKWGLGILNTFQSKKVLRPEMYGGSVWQTPQEGCEMVCGAQTSQTDCWPWPMREMWIAECVRCASQEWGLAGSISSKLGTYLQELSQFDASQMQALFDMWKASEGIGVLRKALSAFQEIWKPSDVEAQPVRQNIGIRRLTPTEALRLQGFPDDWLDGESDTQKYKQCGNAVAVPVVEWVAKRIVGAK